MLDITQEISDGIVILTLSGRFTRGIGTENFHEAATETLSGGGPNIIIDLTNVEDIDHSGLGYLLSLFSKTRNIGGDLKLLNPTQRIRVLLEVTQTHPQVFEIFDTKTEAIQSFSGTKNASP